MTKYKKRAALKTIGYICRNRRIELGINTTELQKKYNFRAYEKIESGDGAYLFESLLKYANILNINLKDLFKEAEL
jgi:transcriptional regulator with XRE-family HTH domain